jgi:hypothetical protein
VTDIEKLLAIEAIKQLKARYFRAMDFKDWADLARLFTADAVFDVRAALVPPGEAPPSEPPVTGVEAIVAYASQGLAEMVSMHFGHTPLIEFQGDDRATGLWPMEDWLYTAQGTFHGQGHYHDTYVKDGGEWRIAHLCISRQHIVSGFDSTPR